MGHLTLTISGFFAVVQRKREWGAFVAVSAGRQGVEDPKKTTAKKKSWPVPIYFFQSSKF
jgi:hypothetical protein